ncbi:CNA protein B-type domain protein [Elysia marginata]|uniref:CNA protein B-type domain protein n=1 Tax=Elysia marginata TaxID=1093978 RepID=A0AAV4J8Z7_9GAST|nr:CNA protein B-type domain protein [Elysia marginata]
MPISGVPPLYSRWKVVFSICLFSFLRVVAQTRVSGTVLDVRGHPLSFADVFFKGSNEGTSTDFDGNFSLKSTGNHTILVVSYIGFQTKEVELHTSQIEELKVTLEEYGKKLDEIILVARPKKRLKKKDNPAYKILKQVWNRKKAMDYVKSYQYSQYTSKELGITNLDSIFLKRVFQKTYPHVSKYLSQKSFEGRHNIPVTFKEIYKKVYGIKKEKKRTDIIAERDEGFSLQSFAFEKVQVPTENIDIDDENILILNKTFTSPISKSGFASYNYILKDSVEMNGKKIYTIAFFPRHEYAIAFEGSFDVEAPSFTLTKINMRISKELNLEFLKTLFVEQRYEIVNDSMYIPKERTIEAEFTFFSKSEKEKAIFIKKIDIYKNFVFDSIKEPQFYNKELRQVSATQFRKDNSFWSKAVPERSINNETRDFVKAVAKSPKVTRYVDATSILTTGHIPVSKFLQYGKYWDTVAFNDIEGFRLKLGFRTFFTRHDRLRSNFYFAYGFKDKDFKFALDLKHLVIQNPRLRLIGLYFNDIEQQGSHVLSTTNEISSQAFGTNVLFSRGTNFFLCRINRVALNTDIGITNNFVIGMGFKREFVMSANPNFFSIDFKDPITGENTFSELIDTSINAFLRWTPGRNVFGYGVQQSFGKKLHPTIIFKYTKGLKGVLGGILDYDKIQTDISYPFLLGILGIFRADFGAGKTFGTVPLTLTTPIPANQAYSLTPNTFTLLNYYDLITDAYVSAHFRHLFNGLIMNRIPLLKKLKLRSLARFSVTYGSISNKNININASNIKYNAPKNQLYYEYGFGFENIGIESIRIFSLEFIWRTSLPQNFQFNSGFTPTFGVRVGITPTSF